MRAKRVSRVIGWEHIPATIRSLSPLERPNYADMFTVELSRPAGVSLEQWLRDVFEAGPVLVRLGVPVIQRRVLGLGLNQRPFAPGYLIGWKIAGGGDDWMRLEADSSLMSANIVGIAAEDKVSVATFIRYERPIAALVWPPVAVVHRQVALALMLRAVALQDRVGSATRVAGL
jgi:hypothetical protein